MSNATSVSIDQGIGNVAAPGTRVVTPTSTTTYKLTATGCGGTATFQLTVVVNPNAAPVAQYVSSDTIPIPAHTTQAVQTKCPSGTQMTGGGFLTGFQGMVVSYNGGFTKDTWEAIVTNNNSTETPGFSAFAVCVANLPGTISPVGALKNKIGTNAVGIATSPCPSDSILLSGGFESQNKNPVYSSAFTLGSPGWSSESKNYTNSEETLHAFAFCYKGEGASSTQQTKWVSIANGSGGHGLVNTDVCPAGTLLTGGGFLGSAGMVPVASRPLNNTWTAYATNNSGATSNLEAIAICTKF